ncbi:MAG: hypothetical protein JJ863_19595 [Deltaproteobacteria bacterium]|nr:hypothetical protein [Deltaproteobacteria bacterium]
MGDRRWVYWKAASGLAEAIEGRGKDVDLLVDSDASAGLSAAGFRPMRGSTALPGVSHWVGLGHGDGLVHLHVHQRLYAARPPVYDLELPWGEWLLRHRREGLGGIPVLDRPLEVATQLVRFLLEPKHWRRGVPDLAALPRRPQDADAVRSHLVSLLPEEALATRVAELGPTTETATVVALARAVERACVPRWSRLPRRKVALWKAGHRVRSLARGLGRRLGIEPPPKGLRATGPGKVIAILGADGAGKSTQVADLEHWLGPVFSLEQAYLGRGDWISELHQFGASLKWRLRDRQTAATQTEPPAVKATPSRRPEPGWRGALREAKRLALAQRKLRDLQRIARLREDGHFVIADRFPHPDEYWLDGPAIPSSDARWRALLAAVERRLFDQMRAIPPDLVLKLVVDPELAHERKPDHRLADIQAKSDALRDARFPAETHEVDGGRPLEQVREELRALVWERLFR